MGDVVVLRDPQTAGLAPALKAAGAHVVCRSHVGAEPGDALAGATLADPERRQRLGEAAHEQVRTRFLPDRHMAAWMRRLAELGR